MLFINIFLPSITYILHTHAHTHAQGWLLRFFSGQLPLNLHTQFRFRSNEYVCCLWCFTAQSQTVSTAICVCLSNWLCVCLDSHTIIHSYRAASTSTCWSACSCRFFFFAFFLLPIKLVCVYVCVCMYIPFLLQVASNFEYCAAFLSYHIWMTCKNTKKLQFAINELLELLVYLIINPLLMFIECFFLCTYRFAKSYMNTISKVHKKDLSCPHIQLLK